MPTSFWLFYKHLYNHKHPSWFRPHQGLLELIPPVTGWTQGDTLDELPVHCKYSPRSFFIFFPISWDLRLPLTLNNLTRQFCGRCGGMERVPEVVVALEIGTDDHRGAVILAVRVPTGRISPTAAGCVSCRNRSIETYSVGQFCSPLHQPPHICHVLNVLCCNRDNLFKSAHGAEAQDAFSSGGVNEAWPACQRSS